MEYDFFDWLTLVRGYSEKYALELGHRVDKFYEWDRANRIEDVDLNRVICSPEFQELRPDLQTRYIRAYRLYCEFAGMQ